MILASIFMSYCTTVLCLLLNMIIGINWKVATAGIKDIKVIIFERSNLAKSAVSGIS